MKSNILFVDDDVNLIQGLNRSLRRYSREWNVYFSYSGREALDMMSKMPIDLIVTDMRMPGMGGYELLDAVSKQYPQTIRFILTGQTDQETSLRSSQVAHQCLAKPCDINKLVEVIQRSLQVRAAHSNKRVIEVITSIKKLPSLPSLYLQLVREMESPNASTKSLGDIISKDITMTAKVLQLVNSAFYGLPTKITNTQQAVVYLGINTLKALVLYEHIFSEYRGYVGKNLSVDSLWEHSLQVGIVAKAIGRNLGLDKDGIDEANVAGMMHDIGKLIQTKIPGFYDELDKLTEAGKDPLDAEYEILGTSHAELGAYLLGLWGLPNAIVQAVSYHHHPSWLEGNQITPLTAVHAAHATIMKKGGYSEETSPYLVDNSYLQRINLTDRFPAWERLYDSLAI